jgi:hypothetical protein
MDLFTVWISIVFYMSIAGFIIFTVAVAMWISAFYILYSWRKSHHGEQNAHQIEEAMNNLQQSNRVPS